MEKLFLHMCCGPCALGSVPAFRQEGFAPSGYYYNPNIHPWREYEKRWRTLKEVSDFLNFTLLPPGEYNYANHLLPALAGSNRCENCYHLRLYETARKAKEHDFAFFSTTLLISPYQDQEKILKIGQAAGDEYGVKFIFKDLRPFFRTAQTQAKEKQFYRQGYCGCIFSEVERYSKKGLV